MVEEARITFYKIANCGYYRYGRSRPEFCGIADTLSELSGWAKGKSFGLTNTYGIGENATILRTFCLDIEKADNQADFLLTTWNEIPSTEGNIPSIDPGSRVGNTDVSLTKIPKNSIPGYATYFWFVPDKSLLATIMFQHRLNGHQSLVKYLKSFLEKCTSHVVIDDFDTENDCSIIGYHNKKDDPAENLLPKFNSFLYRKNAKINYIKDNCPKIRKLIRKSLITQQSPDDSDLFEKILRNMHVTKEPNFENNVKVRMEFDYSLNSEQINDIICGWEKGHDPSWEDVGFKFQGDDAIYWLSHSSAKTTTQLNIKRDNIEVVNTKSLMAEINKKRDDLLALLRQ